MSAIRVLNNRVYLGNDDNARNLEFLNTKAVTHIISLTHSIYFEDKFNYYPIDINDSPNANIYKYFEPCVKFINNALDADIKSNVDNNNTCQNILLVHCAAGVSRSASIVIAYVMSSLRVDYETALGLVRADRHFIEPNVGFVLQLKQWQYTLNIPYSDKLVSPIWQSPNYKVAIYDTSILFQSKQCQPSPDITQIISSYYMEDGIGDYRVELVTGDPKTVFTKFKFIDILKPIEEDKKEATQIIVCPNRVIITFIVAKCLHMLDMKYSQIINELFLAKLDMSKYIQQQLEHLITGVSTDLMHKQLGLLDTYARYINYHTLNDSDNMLWNTRELLDKFETWAIPEVEKRRDELYCIVTTKLNKLGLI